MSPIEVHHQTVVFDAADPVPEAAFWAGVLGGTVDAGPDPDWYEVRDADGIARLAVQHSPDHVRPEWPGGQAQQVHLDLHVTDIDVAHDGVLALGALVLQDADRSAPSGFQVYADPAGHPFCLCWG